ncbi:MAG TPA: hypothetical protein VK772_00640 [Puia sp.]|jgi:hypothetical protein|nr:hypothetical protein [Puia sp.]
MEFPLELLERMVSELIDTPNNLSGPNAETESAKLLWALNLETERLRNDLIKKVFQISKTKEIERFIQNHQSALTGFLDRLYEENIRFPNQSVRLRRVYDEFYQSILSLLSFIEERFSKYFDIKEKVPDVYFVLTAKELESEGNIIFGREIADPADQSVMEKIAIGYRSFLANPNRKTISYADILFWKILLKELKNIRTEPVENRVKVVGGNSFSSIVQVLIYVNYNDKEFVQHMVYCLSSQINTSEDLRDQTGRVLQFSKDLRQLPLKPESSLLPKHPPLIEQLSAWLQEELYYLERRMNMFAISGTDTTLSEKKALVECRVPVDQIGIFFRAASETKLLFTPSQKKLFEQIAPWLSTPRRGKLSADSMRSKSYSPERKDIEGVKDLLMMMYRQVGKY